MNENNENAYIEYMYPEENNRFNLQANNLFMNNSHRNVFDILESMDNVTMLFNRIHRYNIAERTYEDILEEKMIEIATTESENSYNSYERKPDIKIDIKSELYQDSKNCDTSCSICITDFIGLDKVSILKCNHVYHNKCIIEWGMYRQECPVCRTYIEIKKEEKEISTEEKINIIIKETNCTREEAQIKSKEELNLTLNKEDIEKVMNTTLCTREKAIKSLIENENITDAILSIIE